MGASSRVAGAGSRQGRSLRQNYEAGARPRRAPPTSPRRQTHATQDAEEDGQKTSCCESTPGCQKATQQTRHATKRTTLGALPCSPQRAGVSPDAEMGETCPLPVAHTCIWSIKLPLGNTVPCACRLRHASSNEASIAAIPVLPGGCSSKSPRQPNAQKRQRREWSENASLVLTLPFSRSAPTWSYYAC